MSEAYNQKRVLKNTILLYARMLFTMWLNLYTTRLVLTNLGVEDMGVYGVVGSITGLFTVFVSGITSAIQRFITFELGRRDGNVNSVFCTSLNILFIAAFFLLILLEIGGLWVLNHTLNIPEESVIAAFWVYQLSILTCLINIISIPYNALVIAHEKMNVFAFISIFQVALTCVSAYFLSLFQQQERLLIYAVMMAFIGIIVRIVYQIYCHIRFKEAHYRREISKKLLKEISKYAGVSTTSGILQIISNQGITLVINWTFGVALNTVYNIALQLKNSILSFALNLHKASAPQITKTYANGEIDTYLKLTYSSSKIEIYLIYFIMFPFLFRTEYIMKLWLGSSLPPYTLEFAQCIIFISLTYAAFVPISTAVLATTKITQFLIYPEITYLLVLPCAYFSYYLTHSPIWLIVCIVSVDMLNVGFKIFLASKVSLLKMKEMIKNIFYPAFIVAIFTSLFGLITNSVLPKNMLGLIELVICNCIFLILIIYLVGLNQIERKILNNVVVSLIKRSASHSNI